MNIKLAKREHHLGVDVNVVRTNMGLCNLFTLSRLGLRMVEFSAIV